MRRPSGEHVTDIWSRRITHFGGVSASAGLMKFVGVGPIEPSLSPGIGTSVLTQPLFVRYLEPAREWPDTP